MALTADQIKAAAITRLGATRAPRAKARFVAREVAAAFCLLFHATYPDFDEPAFLKACELE